MLGAARCLGVQDGAVKSFVEPMTVRRFIWLVGSVLVVLLANIGAVGAVHHAVGLRRP